MAGAGCHVSKIRPELHWVQVGAVTPSPAATSYALRTCCCKALAGCTAQVPASRHGSSCACSSWPREPSSGPHQPPACALHEHREASCSPSCVARAAPEFRVQGLGSRSHGQGSTRGEQQLVPQRAQRHEGLLGQEEQVLVPRHGDGAAALPPQPADGSQQAGLTAAGLAHDQQALLGLQAQVQTLHAPEAAEGCEAHSQPRRG